MSLTGSIRARNQIRHPALTPLETTFMTRGDREALRSTWYGALLSMEKLAKNEPDQAEILTAMAVGSN